MICGALAAPLTMNIFILFTFWTFASHNSNVVGTAVEMGSTALREPVSVHTQYRQCTASGR
eukprot:m.596674 g.596674  ORF g.596674 m.596674 type:complete len:61 (+) comp22414_c0_seq8:749-931(+)